MASIGKEMATSAHGGNMKLNNNPDFRSITPNEFIEEGTLVWIERNSHTGDVVEEGPHIIEGGWGPIWFGSPNGNKMRTNSKVKLISTVNGHLEEVTWGSFLFTTYYVMNEEKLCIDVETK